MKTEFYEKVVNDLKAKGYKDIEPSNVGFLVENDNDVVVVDYKFMSTGIHYNKKDVDPEEVVAAGFKYYPTWNFYEK